MADTPNPTPAVQPVKRRGGYPGRAELNAAGDQFRRAVARLHREGVRHDPKLIPRMTAIVSEATETLTRLAAEAAKAEGNSVRHQRELKATEDKLRATLRKGVRQGSPHAARVLAQLDARRPENGPHGDDAA